jgi:LmbE family N-acetylglucosaminyl deacetylase
MRRSLSNVGGKAVLWGDPVFARALAHCLDVPPPKKLPFTHGFHAWPARMHPETARRAIERFQPKRVLDPFVGSGTTALEAVRAGLPFAGGDLSRVAIEVAWVRTRIWVPDACRRVEREGKRVATEARDVAVPPPAEDAAWYVPHTHAEIASLRAAIATVAEADVRRVLTVVLSSILVKLSKQASDSVAAPDEDAREWPPGTAFTMFADKATELTKNLLLLSSDLHKRKVKAIDPSLEVADARTIDLKPAAGDYVLTSPPYAGTYDYAHHHRLRFGLFGEDGALAEKKEIGAKRDFNERRYRDDLAAVLRRLKPARMLVLIGDNRGMHAEKLLLDIGRAVGLTVAAFASQDREAWSRDRTERRRREHFVMLTV